jgi:molybdopterin-guanine dinucleotide biosynthesis protein B
MKVFTVNGYKGSGKTTAIESVTAELKGRGYSVGSVKEIDCGDFGMDAEGADTARHRKAGASLVTARSQNETDVMFQETLPIRKILSLYDHDYCILEGVKDINAPKVITAHTAEDIEANMDYRTFAISGAIANEKAEYKGYPVINCLKDTERLADLIEEKVPELMPEFDADCCGACGHDCRIMLSKILSGEKKRDDCVITRADVELSVNGRKIEMVPFVQRLLRNAVLVVVSELEGYEEGADIEVRMGKGEH